jgi:hypothetical protein
MVNRVLLAHAAEEYARLGNDSCSIRGRYLDGTASA